RVASYLQESQRYCRYGEARFGGEVVFIQPCFFKEGSDEYRLWLDAMSQAEGIYLKLLKTSSPQAARTALPNSCKTEIMVHATLEEWMHIMRLRTSKAADPSMREIMLALFPEFEKRFSAVFGPIRDSLGSEN
ncbi:MAG: FAD-dependent thymidylate synthase, partial [Deltaproteobacteria bacterium]|nr:FAD-dependent thymidylate synthase [Deltaproteobacteria bacterium]